MPKEATVRVESTKYPELLVTTPRVQFVDGVAEVDEETAEKLRGLAHMGVVVPDTATKRAPRRKPTSDQK